MPATVLFCFSGTGNSLALARALAGRLPDTVVVPMLRHEAAAAVDDTTRIIGLVYPIYMNQVPRLVAGFLGTLCLPANVYVFATPTHGGLPGHAAWHLRLTCRRLGLPLHACFPVEMINNTPKGVAPKPLMRLEWETDITPEKVAAAVTAADAMVDRIVERVLTREQTNFESLIAGRRRPGFWMMRLVWWMGSLSHPKLNFVLDAAACTGCNRCASVCTSGRIRMEHHRPRWNTAHCHYCYACFNYCPAQAIGVKHYTKKLGRYHHPRVTPEDIASQRD